METKNLSTAKILPWPKERTAEAERASRADGILRSAERVRGLAAEQPIVLLVLAAAVGFVVGRAVGR